MKPLYAYAFSALLFAASALAQAPAPADVQVQSNVMVAMRDGVKLATDIYLPAKVEGKLPVILTRLPYNKTGAKSQGEYYARKGYAYVAQDCRGRFGSEGVWHWMTDDAPDGVDCAAWIAKQPWSNGKIGMIGTSYVGGTQHAMAMEKTPELVTVIPVDAVSNPGRQSMRNAGAFEMRFWNWIMLNAGKGSRASHDPGTAAILKEMAERRLDYLPLLPLRRGTTPLKLAPEYEDWLVSAMGHGVNDSFWEQNNILDFPERYKDIPVYLVGGWYDSWAGNTTANFGALTRALKSDVYLIMGPWIHGKQSKSEHGQVDFGPDAAIADELAWRLEWYEHWLKGVDNSVGKAVPFATKVRIFTMGTGDGHKTEKGLLFHGGSWREENEWPPARAQARNFYFHAGGELSDKAPQAESASSRYSFDPKNPVPTIGGNISSGDGLMLQGAWDQRGGSHIWNFTAPIPLSARNDVVVFQTAPLEADLEVTGEIEVKLWASSSAKDTDFTAKLIDVYPASADWPGGFDLNLADGIVRARFRDGLDKENLMEPGQIYPFTIKLYPTSNVFKKGHRIRVDLSSSNFPRFDVNPNSGEPLNDHREVRVALNAIVHDKTRPSHIVLPVIPKLAAQAFVPAAAPQKLADFKRVVIADDANPIQRAAAAELVNYAGKISGQKLELVTLGQLPAAAPGLSFYVGNGAAERVLGKSPAPWKMEEWMLRTVENGLVLAGDDSAGDPWSVVNAAGSMLAVYTLLEDHLGVRWFWPGEFGEHVPSNPDATVPTLDLRQVPGFEIRSVSLGYSSVYHTKTFDDAARKWARRSRLGWVKSAIFGHSWEAAFELREGQTFKDHPDWFAEVNGKRRPPQMCTTHPEVIARMVDYVLAGKAAIMNISPSDGGSFCECARCQALDVPGVLAYDNKHVQLSDRIFTYANEVARRVWEKNPAKGCGMFAYTYYNKPPVKIEKLEPNLYLSFVFQSAAHRDPENLREWRESVSGWQKLGAKMVVREGWGNHYYHDLPFIHDRQIIANLAEASQLGFVSAYGEGSKSFATMAPNFWAMTHMMWDPRRDTSGLMSEFYRSAYGPAEKEMQAFFETFNRALDTHWARRDRLVDTTGIAYANVIGAWSRLIPPAAIAEAEQHLKAAEAKAPAGEYAGRVSFHRYGFEYTKIMLQLLENYRQLAILGVKLDTFSSVTKERREAPTEREALLKATFDLGEKREQLLLAHRDWAGPDEGLYAFTNDKKLRQWHAGVKSALGIEKPTPLTREALNTLVTASESKSN